MLDLVEATAAGHRAVAQNGEALGDAEHLVELVGDQDHGLALGGEPAHQLGQLLPLGRRQGRRGLVEDHDLGAAVEELDDLQPLPLGDRRVGDDPPRVELEAEPGGELLGFGGDPAQVRAARERRRAQGDVLGRGQGRDEGEVLVDHADPGLERVLGAVELDALAVQLEVASVGAQQAGRDPHQGRLPGSVLAEQGVHLAGRDLERHGVVGEQGAEALADGSEAQGGCCPPCASVAAWLVCRHRWLGVSAVRTGIRVPVRRRRGPVRVRR